MPKWCDLKKIIMVLTVLPLLFISPYVFSQSSNASLSGTVQDVSGGVLPGAIVTATRVETNVASRTEANNAGVYNFNLQPGVYTVSVQMAGFQTASRTEVRLRVGGQIRLDFELNVAGSEVELEVAASAENLILESGSSTGTILQEESVTELPLASNDVMDLINIMGGVTRAEDPIFSNNQQTFAGVTARNINIQRDGVTVNDVRYDSGIVSPQRINPEMVGEFKMILSPVDAEMGRGAGQVQIITKSGANAFHGSGVWNIQNSSLDANEFGNKKRGIEPTWRNLNNYSLNLSGPIIKNRTFFFASWDQQIVRSRDLPNVISLTPCARKGIFRYYDGWINGDVESPVSTTAGSQTRPVVDAQGNPLTPTEWADGSPYDGELRFESVLGQLTDTAREQIAADPINCSQYDFSGDRGLVPESAWDQYRTQYDTTGFVDRFTGLMPMPNNYELGDGLNSAGFRWTRTLRGSDTVYGNGEDNERKSITVKIDHNLSQAHRLSGRYTYETDYGEAQFAAWPEANGGYGGAVTRKPQSFSVNLTSTLRPTLLNEFRMGLSRTSTKNAEALSNPATSEKMREVLGYLMPTDDFPNYPGYPLLVGPGRGWFGFFTDTYRTGVPNSHPYGSRGALPTARGGYDPRWSFTDTLTWTRGAHSFKGGFELRLQKSVQEQNGAAAFYYSANTFPSVMGGNTANSQPAGIGAWSGLVGDDEGNSSTGNFQLAYDLMTYMAGSIGNVRQWYYVANNEAPYLWNDPSKGELNQVVDLRNREFSFFFKDDWKVSNSLTLNLGVRYEYYGVPWVESGQSAALIGGSSGIFGVSGDGFEDWMPQNPVQGPDSMLTSQHFVGPNSPNPDLAIYNKDANNWGPAIGFAYQFPWFGKGKTTLRGGYQLNYTTLGTFDNFASLMARVTGMTYSHTYAGDSIDYPYLDMSMLPEIIPVNQFLPPEIQPMAVRPLTDRSQSLTVWDQDIKNPYVQSLTLSLTRNLSNNLTFDLRYVGTLSRKLTDTVNLNSSNFINNNLLEAFDTVRAGGQSDLLNSIIPASSLTGSTTATGSDQVRTSVYTRTYLAIGDYNTLASTLSTTNGRLPVASGIRGQVLRAGGAPENFIYANPQFSSANWVGNLDSSNYHSMQAQVTMRPTRGLSFQTTYTWSRNLGIGSVSDVRDRSEAYGLLGSHRSHALSSYGTYTLPFGANGFLLRNATGLWKHVAEGWQMSWIFSATSGLPGSVTGTERLWGGARMDQVGPFDPKSGKVTWNPGEDTGRFFGYDTYMQVPDPQCYTIDGSLQSSCASRIKAIALVAGVDELGNQIPGDIIFQHPQPGTRGNFDPNSLTGPGRWSLDMAMGKSFEFMEGKRIDFRIDAQNIFNHATPSNSYYVRNARFTITYNPNFAVNSSSPFGYISDKAGHRTFQAKIRISF
ncbi:MAG: TonB-dependent receptor [Acidobacteria bacterium]|nr:TonB-dependent receptor [Acidobacteriota bacterium]